MKFLVTAVTSFVLLGLVSCNSEPQKEVVLFNAVDQDKDGKLTPAELEAIFLFFDANNDTEITKLEFEIDWVTKYKLGATAEATALFDAADANDDGKITKADLPFIFQYFDMDSDGFVDVNEFLTQWGDLTLIPVQIGK
ncbi:insoluble matrix shell protein 5-like [Haliotis cracherodii]|uniref:insoluble matrix shell protein 5-like n=1 Tax=Haliotis cracherodii TaxID=6455 RepID=UPI0039EC9648